MKTKIFTQLILGLMFLSGSLCQAQNILTDGDFNTTTVINSYYDLSSAPNNIWLTWQNYQINNSTTIVDGVCNIQISDPGVNTYDIQLIQKGFPLIQGHSYRLSLDVKSNMNRTFGIYLGEDGGNWTSLIGNDRYIQYATTEWKTITLNFNATNVFAAHKLSLELGTINGNMYFDNIILQDLGLNIFPVGVLGTALIGWNDDIDMLSTDGIHYTLSNYPLTYGSVKFRQDNAWSINWGSDTFPTGFGYQDGPNIPIPNIGNYNIFFNRITGEYSFKCINNCPVDIGIIGTAVPPNYDWNTDVNMQTNDRITYTLKNYSFVDGEAKFRQDDSWNINWGNNTFPTGTGVLGGDNIPVKSGTYNVSFNRITGYFSFNTPTIGIVGSAVNSWDVDIQMQTTDGITYTLLNYPFINGEAKFRLNNSWDTNWGGYDFPKGFALLNGPNIYIQAGTYNVFFNKLTGAYTFTATTCPTPSIQCPNNIYIANSPGICGAEVFYPPILQAPNCGGDKIKIEQITGLASGSTFPIGKTTNTFKLTNEIGNSATCSFDVVVYDFEPPIISGISDQLAPLWPPNHKMIPIHLDYKTSDNCGDTITSEIYIFSNEPDNGLGDGDVAIDWKIQDAHNILLRAERSGTGKGRIYYISIVTHDSSYNYSYKLVTVAVPHDKGNTTNRNNSSISNESIEIMPFTTNIWPNPGINNFNLDVQTSSNENITLSIFDINGRLISTIESNNKQTIQFGENLKTGIYLVFVRQGENFNATKIIKQ